VISRIERLRVGPIGENVYAIQAGDFGFLVDPGDCADEILEFVKKKDIPISMIVLTHGHLDHSAALPDLMAAWIKNPPPIAIHALDSHYLGSQGEATNKILFDAIHAPSYFSNFWKPLPEANYFLEHDAYIPNTTFRIIHTPGHSAGSICLYDEESMILISGDTLFRDGVGRTDTPDSDYHGLERSLATLARLPGETKVFPGHGPPTTIARELPEWGNRE
jgi:glyoxylase-like metal-dependent hydrolase (beta-lactamase superfamily II)